MPNLALPGLDGEGNAARQLFDVPTRETMECQGYTFRQNKKTL